MDLSPSQILLLRLLQHTKRGDMNRRAFLAASTTSALFTYKSFASTSFSGAQNNGPDPEIYQSSASAHAAAAGNAIYGTPSGSDWLSVRDSISAVTTDWRNNNLDSYVSAKCPDIDPTSIRSTNMPQDRILQNIQMYQPAFQLSDVQNCLSYLDQQSISDIRNVISRIQQQGMFPYFSQAARQAGLLAAYFDNQQPGNSPSPSRSRPNAARPTQPPPDGGGGYNCQKDGALIVGFGIAFSVITIMTLGAGAPLAGGFWIVIGTWGGLGSSAWGAGHAVACGF